MPELPQQHVLPPRSWGEQVPRSVCPLFTSPVLTGHSETPELSPETSLRWSPDPKAQPELTNPSAFRRPARTMAPIHTAQSGSPEPKRSRLLPKPVPGCPQSTGGAEAEQRCCFGAHRNEGPAGLGAGAQPATSRGSTELNSSRGRTRDMDAPRSTNLENREHNPPSSPSASHKELGTRGAQL